MDTPHPGCSDENILRALALEEIMNRGLVEKVELLVRAQEEAGMAVSLETALNGGSHQPSMTCDEDLTIPVHK